MRNDAELWEIAKDLQAGRIFTSAQCHRNEDVPVVFMPLALMDRESMDQMLKLNIAVLYEHMDQAGPMSINGQPCFMSFRALNTDEAAKVWTMVDKIERRLEVEKRPGFFRRCLTRLGWGT